MDKMATSEPDFFTSNIYQNSFKVFEAAYMARKDSVGSIETMSKNKMDKNSLDENLFRKMRGFLVLGRMIGLLPISGVFSNSHTALKFKLLSVPVIINLLVTGLIGFKAALAIYDSIQQSKANALQIAQSVQGTVFRIWAIFNYLYFLVRAESFINIFKTWGKAPLIYHVEDKSLKRDVILLITGVFTLASVDSVLNHMEYFPQFDHLNGRNEDGASGKPTLQVYLERSHPDWLKTLGYHPILAVWAFVAHKFVIGSWNYVDLTIIIFARALYAKFKGLCEMAEKLNEQNDLGQRKINVVDPAALDRSCWLNIVKDHDTLCFLLSSLEKFLSPLIFGSYMVNIYYICMQIIEGLSPHRLEKNLIRSLYAPVSFIALLMRVLLISNMAARINTYAHELGNALKKCPIDLYDAEVARVDRHVTSGPNIGLTGLGCFTVTKPFILSIINVVFTVEIVLLQGLAVPGGACS